MGDVITGEQADAFLREDLQVAELTINTNVKVKLTQNQFDALTSFVFNLGSGNFVKSTLLKSSIWATTQVQPMSLAGGLTLVASNWLALLSAVPQSERYFSHESIGNHQKLCAGNRHRADMRSLMGFECPQLAVISNQ